MEPYRTKCTKMNSKQSKGLNTSAKTIKLSQGENTEGKLCDIGYDTKSMDIKRKN